MHKHYLALLKMVSFSFTLSFNFSNSIYKKQRIQLCVTKEDKKEYGCGWNIEIDFETSHR